MLRVFHRALRLGINRDAGTHPVLLRNASSPGRNDRDSEAESARARGSLPLQVGMGEVRMRRENEPPMAEPLAYFITWATYGTWLPGDERGWVEYRHGWKLPDAMKKLEALATMTENACVLMP